MSRDQVSLGMAGLGGWGQHVVRNFAQLPNCDLVALCDADRERLSRHAARHPSATPFSRFEDMLSREDIDAVVVATPAPMHYRMVRLALEAGKHVYVEKPMTLRSDEAAELVELAESLDRKLMVGHLLLYHPAVQMLRDILNSGALGDTYYMYCKRLNLGVVRSDENALWSLAPHDISVVQYLFGEEPEHIEASGQCYLRAGVEDVVFANLHFPGGRMANIHVSWLDPHKTRQMVLVGSEKMAVFDDMEPAEKIRIYDKGAALQISAADPIGAIKVRHGDILVPRVPVSEPLAEETAHFIDCILEDKTPRSDGRDGLRVVRILEQVERALQTHRTRSARAA